MTSPARIKLATAIISTLSTTLMASTALAQGACCTYSGCVPVADEGECSSLGGVYFPGQDCDTDDPCAPGACCASLACIVMDAYSCIFGGREFLGAGTDCTGDPCEFGIGACCTAGDCTMVPPEVCADGGGLFLGYGIVCSGEPCTPGSCCLPGDCQEMIRYNCIPLEGEFVPWLACDQDPCSAPDLCPADALYSQSRDGPLDFTAYTSERAAGFERMDHFSGVPGAIEGILWWGLDMDWLGGGSWEECEEHDPTFDITFRADAGGYPGAPLCTYTVVATRVATGIMYLGSELNEYSVDLPEPCVLTSGWISIAGEGDPECWFLWMSGGLGTHYCDGCAVEWDNFNLSFCLLGTAGGVYGACCDDPTGECNDNVDITDCIGESQRFWPDDTCDELNPPCGVITGACCHPDATCTTELEADCLALGSNWLGAFTICDYCPCIIPCPPNSIPEGEPICYDGYIDVFNGGCDADTVAFSPIVFCETVCGRGGFFDTGYEHVPEYDWYEIDVPDDTVLTWTVEAEYPVGAWIVDGREGCDAAYVVASAGGYECDTVAVSVAAGKGIYWVVTGAIAWTDTSTCGAYYTATLTRSEPCPGDMDGDGDLDFADFEELSLCLTGPYMWPTRACDTGDFDLDDDIDMRDFDRFQRGFGRPLP